MKVWFVQFYHGYFGWLTLDEQPYRTKEEAEYAMKMQPKCYKRRVICREG